MGGSQNVVPKRLAKPSKWMWAGYGTVSFSRCSWRAKLDGGQERSEIEPSNARDERLIVRGCVSISTATCDRHLPRHWGPYSLSRSLSLGVLVTLTEGLNCKFSSQWKTNRPKQPHIFAMSLCSGSSALFFLSPLPGSWKVCHSRANANSWLLIFRRYTACAWAH